MSESILFPAGLSLQWSRRASTPLMPAEWEEIPIEVVGGDTSSIFTLPKEIYLQMYEADFFSRIYIHSPFIIVNLARREEDEVKFTIFVMVPENEQNNKHNIYSCNLFQDHNGGYRIRAQ